MIGKFLEEYADSITLNANDVFAPAADSVDIDIYDLPELFRIEKKYGYSGVEAFMAKIADCEPQQPTKDYKKAKAELKNYVLFEDCPISEVKQRYNYAKTILK